MTSTNFLWALNNRACVRVAADVDAGLLLTVQTFEPEDGIVITWDRNGADIFASHCIEISGHRQHSAVSNYRQTTMIALNHDTVIGAR